MGRNNKDFEEGKDHILTWTIESGDTVEQLHKSSGLNPDVDKQKASGKYIASLPKELKPVKGSKVKWKAVDSD